MDHLIIDRPEAVEVEHLLVPLCDGLHLALLLVTDAVIDVQKFGDGHKSVKDFSHRMVLVTWKENSSEVITLDERVNSVTVGLYGSNDNSTKLVGKSLGSADTDSTTADGLVVDTCSIIDGKRDILDTITVLGVMSGELFVVGGQGGCENESEIVVTNNMGAVVTVACLQTLQEKQFDCEIYCPNQNKSK